MAGSNRGGKDGRFIWYSRSVVDLVASAFTSTSSGVMRDVGGSGGFFEGSKMLFLAFFIGLSLPFLLGYHQSSELMVDIGL